MANENDQGQISSSARRGNFKTRISQAEKAIRQGFQKPPKKTPIAPPMNIVMAKAMTTRSRVAPHMREQRALSVLRA